jgi:nitrite reductase (NO-forming)
MTEKQSFLICRKLSMTRMNKAIIPGVAAGILLVGMMLSSPAIHPFESLVVFAQEVEEENTTGVTKKVTLIASEEEVQVAPDNALFPGGVTYNAMVFNGTIPGPVISVDQHDTIEFTLINEGEVIHSMDFHAGYGPSAAVGADASETGSNVQPGESVTWTWSPPYAGVFYYHCAGDGLNGVWEHIANGMSGGIVVHPENERPAKEFYVVFGEIYSTNVEGLFMEANGTGTLDLNKFLDGNPDIVMTNGMAHKYVPAIGAISQIELNPDAELFQVQPGELTRWYIVNAGPNDYVAFHFISGMLSVRDGSVQNRFGTQVVNDEGWTIPPGSGSVIESVFPEEGVYVGVDHAMNDVLKGAAFAILATEESTPDDHPAGTFVPPRGSDMVSSPTVLNETAMPATDVNATDIETVENATLPIIETNVTEPGEPLVNITETANETDTTIDTNVTETMDTNVTDLGPVTDFNMTENETMDTNVTDLGPVTDTGEVPATGANGAADIGVSIVVGSSSLTDDSYDPNPVEVSAGSTITWTNDDSQPHTVTAGENAVPTGQFDSGIMAPAATWEHTFDAPGEFPYYCILHPNMVGTVIVS